MGSSLRAVVGDIIGGLSGIAIGIGVLRLEDTDLSLGAVGVGIWWDLTSNYVYDHDPLAVGLDNFWRRRAFSVFQQAPHSAR